MLSNGTDKVTDTAGIDTITSTITRSLATFTTIDKLTLLGTAAINGTGNGLANTITGNGKNNTLSGVTGNDTLMGGIGNDTLRQAGTAKGDAGNDVLVGGVGKDTMTGGAGLDDFDFNAVTEMGKTAATRDVITDFTLWPTTSTSPPSMPTAPRRDTLSASSPPRARRSPAQPVNCAGSSKARARAP